MSTSDHRQPPITDRLVKVAVESSGVEEFMSGAGDILSSSPLKVQRVFLSLQTLHPAFRARTYLWRQGSSHVNVVEWPHGLRNRPGYYDSPDHHVHSTGTELRVKNLQKFGSHPCDLYGQLRDEGYTDYLIVPLPFSDGTVNTLSIATKRIGGFPARSLDWFRRLTGLFVIVFERYAALETRGAALEAYLGRSAAREVLKGQIRSGHGEEVEAAILFADLHGFTELSSSMSPRATVRLLNTYFDCLVGPIEEHGGYVLKFIGDAILAFFPSSPEAPPPDPVEAVRAIRRRLKELNESRRLQGHAPLTHSACLHFGRVLFGNVGSSERLDFTVIGAAVNVAARGLDAAKSRGLDYVFTAPFVERFGDESLKFLDEQKFEDVMQPITIYTFGNSTADGEDAATKRHSAAGSVHRSRTTG